MTSPATLARALHGVIEPFHAILYLSPTAHAAWEQLGLEPRGQGYVAGRIAPFGPVGPDVANAVSFNFNPALFDHALPAAWDIASPAEVLATRARIVETIFTDVGAPTDRLAEATAIAVTAAEATPLPGRPLAAANRRVPPPGTPWAALWQALAVVREHRGDGHVALLVAEDLAPVDALVLYSAWQSNVSRRFLQRSRLWDDEAWAAGEARLRSRGLLDDDGLTADGEVFRGHLEQRTDELAAAPWVAIGADASLLLFDLMVPVVRAMAAGGLWKREVTIPDRPA
ncbi:hypothetical protein [Euzebya sp.]|uniref:SCO6745 family protein n=1 Tax=Euzebya sp. TaxID=1971409 RepID=UPI00351589FC